VEYFDRRYQADSPNSTVLTHFTENTSDLDIKNYETGTISLSGSHLIVDSLVTSLPSIQVFIWNVCSTSSSGRLNNAFFPASFFFQFLGILLR
jgi:hypothetical protein